MKVVFLVWQLDKGKKRLRNDILAFLLHIILHFL